MMARHFGLVLTAISVFGLGLPGAVSAVDATAKDSRRAAAPAPVRGPTVKSDFSAFMAPEVPAETQRLALRKLWRLIGWESDGLGTYDFDYAAARTAQMAAISGHAVSGGRETRR